MCSLQSIHRTIASIAHSPPQLRHLLPKIPPQPRRLQPRRIRLRSSPQPHKHSVLDRSHAHNPPQPGHTQVRLTTIAAHLFLESPVEARAPDPEAQAAGLPTQRTERPKSLTIIISHMAVRTPVVQVAGREGEGERKNSTSSRTPPSHPRLCSRRPCPCPCPGSLVQA